MAASVAFLIARYFARERILKLVEGNKKFLAIDKAIGENGFRVVTLLRLSPLLPFSLGNYLYGLTSVKFVPYVLGRFVSMLIVTNMLKWLICYKCKLEHLEYQFNSLHELALQYISLFDSNQTMFVFAVGWGCFQEHGLT